jgi:glucose-1-phosphate cytidylyltransferase
MKVIILAGGFGTRLSEYTDSIPKPMVSIGGKPILWHIMKRYAKYGFNDFYIALGYKAEVIKNYFLNYNTMNSDFSIDLSSGRYLPLENGNDIVDWKVSLVDTGLNTMTGGRLKRLKKFVDNSTFFLTYGDGVADINIQELLDTHNKNNKMVTVTAVHPGARFGELEINNDVVSNFKEKPQTGQGWINGGFFVINPDFFDFIENDQTILEKSPLERVASIGQLSAYKHNGFWQCMDTKRDKDTLETFWASNNAPWI